MKIAIMGGGGVGAYLGAVLSKRYDTTLISKTSFRPPAVYDNGIQLFPDRLKIVNGCEDRFDFLIIALKSNALKQRMEQIVKCATENTLVLPLLNGVEPYFELKKHINPNNLAKGAIYIISNKQDDKVVKIGKEPLVVMERIDARSDLLAEIFKNSSIKVKCEKDIDKEIWKKYLFIAATAALTSYYAKSFGEIAVDHLTEFEKILEEISAIAETYGVSLTPKDRERAVSLLLKSPYEAKSSLQLDIEKRSDSELENIVGFLAKRASGDSLLKKIYLKLQSIY